VLKADNALPFVPSMTFCEVTQRHSDTVFDRDIALSSGQGRGARFTERITLEKPHRVTFTRIAGPVLGTIANEIEGPTTTWRSGSASPWSWWAWRADPRRAGVRRFDDRRLPQGRGGHPERHAPPGENKNAVSA